MTTTRRSLAAPALALLAGLPLFASRAGAATPAALTEIERLAIKQACADVSTRYSYYLDTADYKAMPGAFTPDGVWEVLGNRHEGRRAIGDYWRTRTAGWKPGESWRHVITNQLIEPDGRDRAHGTAYFTLYRFDVSNNREVPGLAPALLTRSTDEYARTAQGWLIASRQIEMVAAAAA